MSGVFRAIHYAVTEELKPFPNYRVDVAIRNGLTVNRVYGPDDFASGDHLEAATMLNPMLSIYLYDDALLVTGLFWSGRYDLYDSDDWGRFLACVRGTVTVHDSERRAQ